MFKLLRYFSVTSLIAMVVAAVILGSFYRHMAIRDLVETAEYRNVVLTQAFSNSVWPQFAPFMSQASDLSGDELRAHPEIKQLKQTIVSQAKGLSVLKVKIFDLNAKTLFSTEAKQIGDVKDPNYVGSASARKGEINSKLEHRASFDGIAGVVDNPFVLSSYLPVRRGEGAPIEAVFEVYADVTPLMNEVGQRLRSVILVVIAVSVLLYAVLFLIVRYADRLIRQQQAERKQAEEKIAALAKFPDESPSPVLRISADGTITYANRASAPLLDVWQCSAGQRLSEQQRDLLLPVLNTGVAQEVEIDCENHIFSIKVSPIVAAKYINIYGFDITERKRAQAERETLYRQLADASREAGKAEIATGVLHNVGNVLNSVNVSATLVSDKFRKSKIGNLTKVSALFQDHADDLATFLTRNEKGKQLPVYIGTLADHLESEREETIKELQSIAENINHIKQIVGKQQSYANDPGIRQPTVIADLLDDALSINVSDRHAIDIVREYPDIAAAMLDKHKVLQIVVNLISNAKEAINEHDDDKQVALRIKRPSPDHVCIEVSDNGIGIEPQNLSRIFEYGFTTKHQGHGFGLHVSANSAKEMGGSLTCKSEGIGKGATFILELPFVAAEMVA